MIAPPSLARCFGWPTSSKAIGANRRASYGPQRGSKRSRRTRQYRYAQRTRWTCDADPRKPEEGPLLGPSVRLPRQEAFALEYPVLGWDRALSLHQENRPCDVHVATRGGAWRHGDADTGA